MYVCVCTCCALGLLENLDDDVPHIYLGLKLLYFLLYLSFSLRHTHTHTHMHQMFSCVPPCFYSFEIVRAPYDNSFNVLSCSALDHNFMLVS